MSVPPTFFDGLTPLFQTFAYDGSILFVKMLSMDQLDLIFEQMVFSRNKNLYVIYTATITHLKIGEKIDVIAVSMATMTFQYGGYLSFKLLYNLGN